MTIFFVSVKEALSFHLTLAMNKIVREWLYYQILIFFNHFFLTPKMTKLIWLESVYGKLNVFNNRFY